MPIGEEKYLRWFERTQPALEFVDTHLATRRTAIDAGAAEGHVTRWLSERFALVHAFEPTADSFAHLAERVAGRAVICHNVALGNVHERRRFEGKRHSAHATDATQVGGIEVCRLDDFDIADVDFLKIDVEGFEMRVIRGATAMLERHRPMVMFERKKLWYTRYGDDNPLAVLEAIGYREVFRAPLDTLMVHGSTMSALRGT